jgi:orotate phosphoribosyltransferase
MLEVLAKRAAAALLDADVFGLRLDVPVTFKSGIISPVYLDNRRLIYYPDAWHIVIEALHEYVKVSAGPFDVLAGIETAGIPHCAVLAYAMRRPSVFVRKASKGHGLQQRVEGGDVSGKRVLLLEDQITTGGSSLSGVEALRAEGATVQNCIALTSYDFAEAQQAFAEAGVRLHVLVPFPRLLASAEERGLIDATQREVVNAWLADPHGWRPA